MDDTATAGPLLRWGRALVLATVGLITGATFHVAADGLLPGPWALAAMVGLSTSGVAPFLGVPASTRRVVGLLVVWQTLVHGALTVLSGHRGDLPGDHPGAGGDAHGVVSSRVHHLLEDMTGPHAAMAVGHLLAAAVVGMWLAAGERALWRLLGLAIRPVLSVVEALCDVGVRAAPPGPAVRTEVPQVAPGVRLPCLWFLVRAVPRRGPPVAA